MGARNLAVPLLAFAGGAILGRLFGLQGVARGTAITGMAAQSPQSLLIERAPPAGRTSPRRRRGARPARQRGAPKRS